MQIVNHSACVVRFDDISIQTIAVGNDRHLFSYKNDTTKGDKIISSVSTQGVCTTCELREMKNGGKVVQPSYFVLDDNTKAQIIKTGKQFFFDGKNKNTNVFDYAANGGNIDDMMIIGLSDDNFVDVHGNQIPVGIPCSYIDGMFDNQHYKLRRACEILQEQGIDVEIGDIPYYNAEKYCDRHISFYWTPSAEQQKLINDTKGDRYKTMFDHDMLGLRAGGAAKGASYYDEGERDEDD